MENKSYAVFLDIDGTLYTRDIVPDENIKAINTVRKMGSMVFLNTGRSYGYIPKELIDAVPLDGIVAGIGTDLRLHGKQIFSYSLKRDLVKSMAEHFMGDLREVGFEGEDKVIWINPNHRRSAEFFLHSPEDFDTVYAETKISKVYISGQLIGDEANIFSRDFVVFQHGHYAELAPKGFSKAKGMERMAAAVGVDLSRCIAMGDSLNDEDMLRAAGISVAMGNATQEIKDICDYTSCDAAQAGVAQALRHFIISQNR